VTDVVVVLVFLPALAYLAYLAWLRSPRRAARPPGPPARRLANHWPQEVAVTHTYRHDVHVWHHLVDGGPPPGRRVVPGEISQGPPALPPGSRVVSGEISQGPPALPPARPHIVPREGSAS